METWIVFLGLGLLTFLTRLSFIAFSERIVLPAALQRGLRLVPIAALSAIIAPELARYNDALFLSPLNPRLLAGLVATGVAYITKNVIWTIVAGMATLWILSIWL